MNGALKEKDLREAAVCVVCDKPFGASGLPFFWRVSIERFGVDLSAMRRQDGLAQMLGGNAFLASVMGPDDDMAKPLMEKVTVTVCEPCGTSGPARIVAFLAEWGTEQLERKRRAAA